MSLSFSRREARRQWRSDVAQRIGRPVIIAALAYGAFWAVWSELEIFFPWGQQFDVRHVVARTLLWLIAPVETLLPMAIATVAVARGASGWLAYPLALLAAAMLGTTTSLVLDPHPYLSQMATARFPVIALLHMAFLLPSLFPGILLYVYASNAQHRARLLQTAEAERAAEAERLARQRLQAELASIDHDLVLAALRRSLDSRASDPVPAEALLAIVAEYLRAAQQRGSTEPQRIANALAELRQACTPAARVIEEGSTT